MVSCDIILHSIYIMYSYIHYQFNHDLYIFQQLNHNNDYILSKRRHFVKKASEETWEGGGVSWVLKRKVLRVWGLFAWLGGDKFFNFAQNLSY